MGKTKIEIIDETVEYYKTHPRALSKSPEGDVRCVYLTKEGHRCAHSRCIRDEFIKDIKANDLNNANAHTIVYTLGDDIYKEEYQGHDSYFWSSIQTIHDNMEFWQDNELTEEGIKYVNDLKEQYKINL